MPAEVTRRKFVSHAAVGAAALAGGVVAGRFLPVALGMEAEAKVRYGTRRKLAITEARVQMVDRTYVYHWAFMDEDALKPMPSMPGPLIQAISGEAVSLTITNHLEEAHGFRIPGVGGVVGGGVTIAPHETVKLNFDAPKGGSYLYYDHLNAPVNRVLGLHGPMIVLPTDGNTPYSDPTPMVQQLFNDLGTTDDHPGEAWNPERSKIWLFASIDPRFNEMAERGENIDPVTFKDEYLPRYFTINGLAGAYASHDHSTVPTGRIGQPLVIRLMNAGMVNHSPHIHGNHVYILSQIDENLDNQVQENVWFLDTHTVGPDQRMDWLLPFHRPPDIAGDESIPLRERAKEELGLTLGDVPQSPLAYPMHCHMEMSQTAAGGNYPQGLVTHWEITGDLDGVDFPHSDPVERGGENTELMEEQAHGNP